MLNRDNTNLFQRQSNRDLSDMDSSEPVFNFDVINERSKESARVHVPITLCLVILTSYVCGGGVLFSLWEGWNFLDGAYFCFVTLSITFRKLMKKIHLFNNSSNLRYYWFRRLSSRRFSCWER